MNLGEAMDGVIALRQRVAELEREHNEDQGVIRVWRGRCERAEADNAAQALAMVKVLTEAADPRATFETLVRAIQDMGVVANAPHSGAALLEYVRALEDLYAACAAYFVHAAANHDDGCPEDDTCECPHIVRVNEAFRAVDALKERKP